MMKKPSEKKSLGRRSMVFQPLSLLELPSERTSRYVSAGELLSMTLGGAA